MIARTGHITVMKLYNFSNLNFLSYDFFTLYHKKLDFSRRYKNETLQIKLTDKFSGVRLVTVTAKTAGEAMDLVDRSEGEYIAVIEELV